MKAKRSLAALFLVLFAGFVLRADRIEPPQAHQVRAGAATSFCKWSRGMPIPADQDPEDVCCHCTSIPVGKAATVDGGTLTSHSCDGHYEIRIHVVTGGKHAAGAMRAVMKGGGLGADRDAAHKVGEIPEVAETLTRYDAAYPFMNEKAVEIGETTIGGRRELFNDEGWFDIMELERIALERATTAREAIRIMGELAVKYGYGDSGECLTVIDPNEAWQFEIFGPGPLEKGAVWAARRIPDGEVGVSANRPRITTLDLNNKDFYLASDNVMSLAEAMGWWKKGETFVFNKAYSDSASLGSTRREWRVLSLLAPSLNLDPWDTDLPFSVKPDKKVSPRDLMRIHRDSYEGTDFDLTKGLAAGPFANPNRWATNTRPPEGTIGWERSISVFRCSYATVLQSRGGMPAWVGGLAWFAEDDPKTSVYVPFYAGNTRIPEAYEIGTRAAYDRKSAWWAANFIGNWANLRFNAMIEDIRKAQANLEDGFFTLQPTIEKRAMDLYKENPQLAREYLTDYSNTMAQRSVEEWWKLADYLVVKYNDGYVNTPTSERPLGYPKDWLDAVGYGKTKIQAPKKKGTMN